jgi:hypothetical protein
MRISDLGRQLWSFELPARDACNGMEPRSLRIDAARHQIAEHPYVVVPTRGRMRDIGRGVTHKTWIGELCLQTHSETGTVERAQHAYESLEAYLREFVRVMAPGDRGMNAVMIRRVTQRALPLVTSYLELYQRYDGIEHHFRLSQLRHAFTLDDILNGEPGGRRRSTTEDQRT